MFHDKTTCQTMQTSVEMQEQSCGDAFCVCSLLNNKQLDMEKE